MHRVNNRPKRTVALRIVAYSVTVILSALTTVLLLFIALGYKFNNSGEVVKSGLVLVDNKPEAAQIYINGKLEDNQSPGRFILPVGTYEISLEREGYSGWKKDFTILPQAVESVAYPLLIPKQLQSEELAQVDAPTAMSQSPDSKNLLYYTADQQSFVTVLLRAKDPVIERIAAPTSFTRQNGLLGQMEFIDWTRNSKRVIVRHTQPNQAKEYVLYDLANPNESINVTKQFTAFPPEQLQFVGGETGILYGIHEGVLRQYNTTRGEAEVVLEGIYAYKPYGDKTIAFVRQSEDELQVEVGVASGGVNAVLLSSNDTSYRPLIEYGEYDSRAYFVVADTAAGNTQIFRDPLKKPILKKQIPFLTLQISSAEQVQMSPGGQYVYVRSGQTAMSYDFENKRRHTFSVEEEVTTSSFKWMNGAHVMYQTAEGLNYLIEFDGQNKKQMLESNQAMPLFYGSDQKNAYRIISTDTGTRLDRIPLTVE